MTRVGKARRSLWAAAATAALGIGIVTPAPQALAAPGHAVLVSTPASPAGLFALSIGNALRTEGDTGIRLMGFRVSLSAASPSLVVVTFTTQAGTATADTDYLPRSGQLIFAPGDTDQIIIVPIIGDEVIEERETLAVQLTFASEATIADGLGIGLIRDDDG